MINYIYAFGSICRGELDSSSDIDILVVHSDDFNTFENRGYSYYKIKTLEKLWSEGNPFAWHLYKESKIVFSKNGDDLLKRMGPPKEYSTLVKDLQYLNEIFIEANISLLKNQDSIEFDLSTIFLVVRNIATCFELGVNKKYCFRRDSAIKISNNKLPIDKSAYETLKKCRILSTRGIGENPTKKDMDNVIKSLPSIKKWITYSIIKSKEYESIQAANIL